MTQKKPANKAPVIEVKPLKDSNPLFLEPNTGHQANFDRTAKKPQLNELSPGELTSIQLKTIFQHFNQSLFNGELPDCMLTMDTSCKSAVGYFSPHRFVTKGGNVIDHICLNPAYVLTQNFKYVCATIVHEQCHLWMHHFSGRPVTNGYHCKKWARKMESVGLIPSDTGKPGGKKTGFRMSDYPEDGGAFEQSATALIKNGYELTWGLLTEELYWQLVQTNPEFAKKFSHLAQGNVEQPKKKKSKGKVKFSCPTCNQSAWGAASLYLVCGHHNQRMIEAASDKTPSTQLATQRRS